jgi:hypothetical protein
MTVRIRFWIGVIASTISAAIVTIPVTVVIAGPV